ncbi:hypothetical protein GCM10009789_25630 [Kribbella sancticallisti]|uniref:Uncharacterized protein n=1 Tax=Kribbella sancticallisti TaxID=460087 RepID=A0ABN2D8Q7_9ACTN
MGGGVGGASQSDPRRRRRSQPPARLRPVTAVASPESSQRIARYLGSSSTGYIPWVTMLDQNRDSQQLGSPGPAPVLQDTLNTTDS